MPRATLPALSIRQPWADLILWGIKEVENRTWPTRFRGRLLIHAGRQVDSGALARLEASYGVVLPAGYAPRTGAILGMVELVDCVEHHPSPFFHGPWGFVLRDPVDFGVPIPAAGRLGIFQVPRELLLNTPAWNVPFG
jgi:hypothetical protein